MAAVLARAINVATANHGTKERWQRSMDESPSGVRVGLSKQPGGMISGILSASRLFFAGQERDQVDELINRQRLLQPVGHDAARMSLRLLDVRFAERVLLALIVGEHQSVGGFGDLQTAQHAPVIHRNRLRLKPGRDCATGVQQRLDDVDAREATVLKMRFGLDDTPPHTLKEIGAALGLTRERVRQIETEALARLQNSLKDPKERMGLA